MQISSVLFRKIGELVLVCCLVGMALPLVHAVPSTGEGRIVTSVRLGIPTETASAAKIESSAKFVDESAIHQALTAQNWKLARKQVEQTLLENPGWLPSVHIRSSINEGLFRETLENLVEEKSWHRVIELTAHADCYGAISLEARLTALNGLGWKDSATGLLSNAARTCYSQERIAAVVSLSMENLGLEGLEIFRAETANSFGMEKALTDKLDMKIFQLRFEHAFEKNDFEFAYDLAKNEKDTGRLTQIGWKALDVNPDLAEAAFTQAISVKNTNDAYYGQTLAQFKLGQNEVVVAKETLANTDYAHKQAELQAYAALNIANAALKAGDTAIAVSTSERSIEAYKGFEGSFKDVKARALLKEAAMAHENADFPKAISLSVKALEADNSNDRAKYQLGWSYLEAKKYVAAIAQFQSLYQRTSSKEAATGWMLGLQKTGRLNSVREIVKADEGPLIQAFSNAMSDVVRGKRHYLTAYELAPEKHEDLKGIDMPWIEQTVAFRNKTGEWGAGRLSGYVADTEIGIQVDKWSVNAGVTKFGLSAGRDEAGNRHETNGYSPRLKIEREGDLATTLTLGTTPINAVVSAKPTIDLKVRWKDQVQARAFNVARADSTTSLSGRELGGVEDWGRVVETGVKAQVQNEVVKNYSVKLSGHGTNLEGKNVERNKRAGAMLAVHKNVFHEKLEYLSTGPFASTDGYDNNENFHTFGKGGYFSPKSMNRAGWSLHLQTKDARDWVAKLDSAVAYEAVKTDAENLAIAGVDNLVRVEGESESKLALSANLKVEKRLSEKWFAGLSTHFQSSQAFSESYIGVSLRFTPGGRNTVVSRDFLEDPFMDGGV